MNIGSNIIVVDGYLRINGFVQGDLVITLTDMPDVGFILSYSKGFPTSIKKCKEYMKAFEEVFSLANDVEEYHK